MLLRSQFSRLVASSRSVLQRQPASLYSVRCKTHNILLRHPPNETHRLALLSPRYSTDGKDPQLVTKPAEPPKSPKTEEPAPKSLTERLKAFFKQYGKLGLGIYLGVTAVTFSSIYLTLKSGVDVKGLMRKLGLPESSILDGAGTVAVSYAIYKLLMPVRLFVTVALTTWVAKRAPRWGWKGNSPFGRDSGESKR